MRKLKNAEEQAAVLLYELIRNKYRKDQNDIDKKAKSIGINDFAYEIELLGWRYAKENYEVSKNGIELKLWSKKNECI